ncbi:MAG: glycosyltransferase family 4 protein [Promethearchaeota archaeon]
MKKILFLPTRYFPSISGAEFYFQRLAENLNSKYDYRVDIYTSNAIDFKALRNSKGRIISSEDKHFYNVNNLNINRYPVNYDITLTEILKKLSTIHALKELNLSKNQLEKFVKNGPYLGDLLDFLLNKPDLNFDLIHTTFFPYFNCIISLIIGKILNKPVICTPFFHFSNPRYLDPDLTAVLEKFDLLIACTNLEKKFLSLNCNVNPEKVIVIPMGVDYERFSKSSSYNFKEKFFNKREKKYHLILFCGYKNHEKGSLSILKSIPFILRKVKKVYFVFIGPSTIAFNRELSKLKNARIINLTPDNLTGYLDNKKLAAFKEADIYLMPSRSDAFGIAFLEAWAAGIPVIGAKIGATPEVIREKVDGLLVEFDNPFDIAQKVIKLLKNNKLRKKLGLAGQLRVSQDYTWDIVTEKTHIAYQKLLNKNS